MAKFLKGLNILDNLVEKWGSVNMEWADDLSKTFKEWKQENRKAALYLLLFFAIISAWIAAIPELFKNGNIENLKYIGSHEFITVGLMIGMSILIYSIVDKFLDSSEDKHTLQEQKHTLKVLDEKLHLVKSMLETKGLETIVTSEKITKVENNSDEIIMIVDNLYLDLPKDYKASFEGTLGDFGTFFKPVNENMKAGKQYTYYLKYDNNTHNAIKLHMEAHFYALQKEYKDKDIKEPIFILIPSNEFSFFSDIYIYKDNNENKTSAYEWLPTLTKDETLFYLQFDAKQTKKLEHILTTAKTKYGITRGTTLQRNVEYIINSSDIKIIEKEAKNIQIITDDLEDDLKEGRFFETVEENIKAGKKYTYFLPENKDIRNKIEQYKIDHNLSEHSDSVTFKCIPDNMFFFFNNVFIYDDTDDKKSAFEFMPKSNMYFIYDDTQLKKLISNIKSLEISLKKG